MIILFLLVTYRDIVTPFYVHVMLCIQFDFIHGNCAAFFKLKTELCLSDMTTKIK